MHTPLEDKGLVLPKENQLMSCEGDPPGRGCTEREELVPVTTDL